jgi:hypothetical protein
MLMVAGEPGISKVAINEAINVVISEAINAVIRRSTVAISACPEGANRSLII